MKSRYYVLAYISLGRKNQRMCRLFRVGKTPPPNPSSRRKAWGKYFRWCWVKNSTLRFVRCFEYHFLLCTWKMFRRNQHYHFSKKYRRYQDLLLYSLLNKRLRSNFYSKYTFFVIFSNFPSKWKSKWSAKVLHSLGAAKVLQITLTFDLTENFVKLTEKSCKCERISFSLTNFFVKPRVNATKSTIFQQ